MIGAHDHVVTTVEGPFDAVTLLLNNHKCGDRMHSVQEVDRAWTGVLEAQAEQKTPKRDSIHAQWSPSLETPKTGISSLDIRMNGITVTSPGLFNSPLQQHRSLLPSEEDGPLLIPYSGGLPKGDLLGFTTGAGKRISSPSKAAKSKSKLILEQVRLELEAGTDPLSAPDPPPPTPHFVGFTTGSGKKIDTPSRESTAKARLLAEECEMQPSAKQPKLHVSIDTRPPSVACAKVPWRDALKCSPCRDLDMALLSGV